MFPIMFIIIMNIIILIAIADISEVIQYWIRNKKQVNQKCSYISFLSLLWCYNIYNMVCCVLQAIPIEINIINKQNNFHFVVFMKPRKPFIHYIYIYCSHPTLQPLVCSI